MLSSIGVAMVAVSLHSNETLTKTVEQSILGSHFLSEFGVFLSIISWFFMPADENLG